MSNNSTILDSPIEEINVSILKPTRYVPRKPPSMIIRRNFSRFADWIIDLVPVRMRRRVNERIGRLRGEIRNIYQRYDRLQLYRREAPLRGYLTTHRIDGQRGYDQRTFTQYIRPRVIRFLDEREKPLKMKLILTCRFKKGDDTNYGYFHTDVRIIMEDDDLGKIYNLLISEILAKIDKFQNKGSGWQFEQVVSLDINIDPFEPLGGSSYFPLPYKLYVKKAIINVKNEDNECFKWTVSSAVFPKKKNGQRLNNELRENAAKLNWEGISFPTPLCQISRFEEQNSCKINVYGWTGTSVYPLRIGRRKNEYDQCIDLLLLEDRENQHYCLIKNMSALTASQFNKHKGKRYVCEYCCNSFQWEVTLKKHVEYCSSHKAVKVVMPEKGTTLQFKNYQRKMRVPFVVYADFEAFPEGISTCTPDSKESYTNQYQKHRPCGFCYCIKCFDEDNVFHPVLRHYTITHKDENVGKVFVEKACRVLLEPQGS